MTEFFNDVAYAFHVVFHPFDGFWDLKHEKRGSVKAGIFFVIMLIITFVLNRQFTGFILNTNQLNKLNIFNEINSVLLPLLLWCISNWCLTTLNDGEGNFKDIFIYTTYSLVPMILLNIPMIVYSNFITVEETSFYFFFTGFATVWTGFLIIIGTLVTHQFSMSKTLFSVLVIIVGMGVIAFIGLLFFSLVQQIALFVINVYREYTFRI